MGATIYNDQPVPVIGVQLSALPAVLENAFFISPYAPGGATFYVQIHNLAAPPVGGEVPVYWFPLRPEETVNFTAPGPAAGSVIGRKFLIGLGIWLSTSATAYGNAGGDVFSVWSTHRLID